MSPAWSSLAVAGLAVPAVHAALYDTVIQTAKGPVQGYAAFTSAPVGNYSGNWADVTVWKGIPFAATTGGENRWKPPQPVEAWNTTLDASEFGDVCPGGFSNTPSEDCLNLNVWSAANSTDAKLPVVMWSYPAGGSAADSQFDGAGMADAGVVFVNYNYRTGSYGWMVTPELTAENYARTGSNSSGNWGILDQFAALQWVHDNIAAFGGDPDKITVQGQSAGSAATYHILNSPLHGVKIAGAIIESGVRDPHDPLCTQLAEAYNTLEDNSATGIAYMASMNCSDIACMRALDTDTLNTDKPGAGATFGATLDYYAIPDTYLNTLLKGIAQDVPVITGNTKDESGATYGLNLTMAEYYEEMNSTFGNWTSLFEAAWPTENASTAGGSYNAQFTDRNKVGTYFWSQLWATNATSPVYTYLWDHAPPGQSAGAYHESEITYALNNLYGTDSPWVEEDYEIAATLNGYWVNFIKTGNPNGGSLTEWAPTNSSSKTVMEVGNGWGQQPIARENQIQLLSDWFQTLHAY